MSWLIDRASTLYVLLGLVAIGFVVAFWFNRRVKFLGYAAGVVGLIVLVWLLTLLVPTDRKQIESNVRAMADAVVKGNVDDLFKHIADDFRYKGRDRKEIYERTQNAIKLHKISSVNISSFEMEGEPSRSTKSAKASFLVTAYAQGLDQPFMFRTKADFVLDGEHWKMKGMAFFKAIGDKDQEIDLPGF
jgi:hypothetical protein